MIPVRVVFLPLSLPLSGRWDEGVGEERWGGGHRRHHVTHVSC